VRITAFVGLIGHLLSTSQNSPFLAVAEVKIDAFTPLNANVVPAAILTPTSIFTSSPSPLILAELFGTGLVRTNWKGFRVEGQVSQNSLEHGWCAQTGKDSAILSSFVKLEGAGLAKNVTNIIIS
jgi:hypothetical protein